MTALNEEPTLFIINQELLDDLKSGECKPVFTYPLKPSRGGQGKSAECFWQRKGVNYKSPQFLTEMTTVKYGAMPYDSRNTNRKPESKLKDVPSIAFGTKFSENFGEFVRILDDEVMPKALLALGEQHFTSQKVKLWNRRLSKDDYGSPEYPGDPEKKAKYLAEEDWTIAIKFKYDLTKPNGEGKCFSRFTFGKKRVYPKGCDIDQLIRGRTQLRLAFKIDRSWVTVGDKNPETKMVPYTLGAEVFVNEVIIKPREEKKSVFSMLSLEEQAEFDGEEADEGSDEGNEKKPEFDGMPNNEE